MAGERLLLAWLAFACSGSGAGGKSDGVPVAGAGRGAAGAPFAGGGGAAGGKSAAGAPGQGGAGAVSGASSGGSGAATSGAGSGTTAGGAGSGGEAGSEPIPPLAEVPWVDANCPASSGTLALETAEFCVSLTPGSQTVAALRPKAALDFDFTPGDLVATRSGPGYFHLGDLTLRVRAAGSDAWQNVTTSASRTPVEVLELAGDALAAADLSPALPAELPLRVTRTWALEGGRLALRFELSNRSTSNVEVGALGIPMVFNNVITNRSLDQAHARCSFSDPYIGRDAGYVQVTRLSGQGPALLVLPDGKTPFEAYNPILNAPKAGSKDPIAIFTELTPRGQTFEGFLEWMVHTKAYAEGEWSRATPWLPATALTLAPGASQTYGVRFVLSDTIRHIEAKLAEHQRPLAVGIPGYVLPTDTTGRLFLKYPWAVTSLAVEPPGALTVTAEPSTPGGYRAYSLAAATLGRARLDVTYADGTVQAIHYDVIRPARELVAELGHFLTTKAWFDDDADPFGRSPSVMTYDHEAGAIVTQTKQAWVCGLGDEGGSTWLAGAMKLLGQPLPEEVQKYEAFVDGAVWGGLQYSSGAQSYGVKRTLFYYEPSELPAGYYDPNVAWLDPNTGQTYWGAWSKSHTLEVPRSYNYPHVAALYWSLYRVARNTTGLTAAHPWDWYLTHAYETAVAMTTIGNEYAKFGLMDGSVFLEILRDLEREGMSDEAEDLEARMQARETVWRSESYPFGSEMPWDSTGQEEVYAWTRHFGDHDKAKVCIDAITGYMPTVPHWAYDGCARRYWDFIYGGAKLDRLERMIHHYGSSLNAIPVLTEFRDHPDDLHLLRIGYAGMLGALTNVAEDGFPSMAFHSFPDTLAPDPVSGDYGPSFFGYALNAAAYLVEHPELGWQAFGGNVAVEGTTVSVAPLDAFRQRVYLAPLGLWLTLDAGRFESVSLDTATGAVHVTLAPADAYSAVARLRVEQPAAVTGVGTYVPAGVLPRERDAYVVALGTATTGVDLVAP